MSEDLVEMNVLDSEDKSDARTEDWFSRIQDSFDTRTVSQIILCVLSGKYFSPTQKQVVLNLMRHFYKTCFSKSLS